MIILKVLSVAFLVLNLFMFFLGFFAPDEASESEPKSGIDLAGAALSCVSLIVSLALAVGVLFA